MSWMTENQHQQTCRMVYHRLNLSCYYISFKNYCICWNSFFRECFGLGFMWVSRGRWEHLWPIWHCWEGISFLVVPNKNLIKYPCTSKWPSLVHRCFLFSDCLGLAGHDELQPGRRTIHQSLTFWFALKMHQLLILLQGAVEQLHPSGSMLDSFPSFQLPYLVWRIEEQRGEDGGGEHREISGTRRKKRWFIIKERIDPRMLLHPLLHPWIKVTTATWCALITF